MALSRSSPGNSIFLATVKDCLVKRWPLCLLTQQVYQCQSKLREEPGIKEAIECSRLLIQDF